MNAPGSNTRHDPLDAFEQALRAVPLAPALTLRWSWFWVAMTVAGSIEAGIVYWVMR